MRFYIYKREGCHRKGDNIQCAITHSHFRSKYCFNNVVILMMFPKEVIIIVGTEGLVG